MSIIDPVVWEIHQVLTQFNLPYAIIGGTAVQYWGEPRFTKLVKTSSGYPVDMSFGLPGYEEQVISRSVDHKLSPRKSVKICSAEDLIIYKAIAGRVQDVQDIEGVIVRQGNRLDTPYIRQWLSAFAELLESSEVSQRFEQAWRKYQSR